MKTCCGQTFDLHGYGWHLDKEHKMSCDLNDVPCGHCANCAEMAAQDTRDPNFESLLETEPSEHGCDHQCGFCRARGDMAKKTEMSMADRIKDLEGVLVAVRAKVGWALNRWGGTHQALCEMRSLINETLDPCKPWCVLEPGHGGTCTPREYAND